MTTHTTRAEPLDGKPVDHEQLARIFVRCEVNLRQSLNRISQQLALGSPPSELFSGIAEGPAIHSPARLAAGGVVIVTDDGRGIARAVAADLRALGHPVVRARHGVRIGAVEGVNLTSAAAVAALVDRARERGPITAIVHASPLDHPPHSASADEGAEGRHDRLRALLLLVHASAGDLLASVARGGASVLLADHRHPTTCRCATEIDRSLRNLEEQLPGVRVRRAILEPSDDAEVLAAGLVQELFSSVPTRLGRTSEPPPRTRTDPGTSVPFLLGAPDRASWTVLARAIVAWLERNPEVSLIDLAYTLHLGQPDFPFRIGLVVRTRLQLASRLLALASRPDEPLSPPAPLGLVEKTETARDRLNELAVELFEAGRTIRTEALFAGRHPRLLQLDTFGAGKVEPPETSDPSASRAMVIGLRLIDEFSRARDLVLTALLTNP